MRVIRIIIAGNIVAAIVAGSMVFSARAAELTLAGPAVAVADSRLVVTVFLNTGNEAVNAVEGVLKLPAGLALTEIRDGQSIVSFWVKRPTAVDGVIRFSGLTPGGVSTDRGRLFSIIVTPKAGAVGRSLTVAVTDAKVLLNDGVGTSARVALTPFVMQVRARELAIIAPALAAEEFAVDITPPEFFTLNLARADSLYDGQWFVAFVTRDADSGIDRYEAQEQPVPGIVPGDWQPVENPYLLRDQERRSYVYIRAIDRAGNERVAELASRPDVGWQYTEFLFWCILGVLLVGILGIFYCRRKSYGG